MAHSDSDLNMLPDPWHNFGSVLASQIHMALHSNHLRPRNGIKHPELIRPDDVLYGVMHAPRISDQ
ncbi:hypothetical protein SESBI_48012 [Sesbania bispinosa]|nr:hypothetical protein SESBI_48012 [Sesbania bispinosa]